jgi:hypothetical protein
MYLVKSQCYPQCLNTEECQDYKCVCKAEYYQNPTEQCGKYNRLELCMIFPGVLC